MTDELTDRDRRIVAAVASGVRQADVARIARCSTRTVRRTLARPEVDAALRSEREAQTAATVDLLRTQTRGSVERLERVINHGTDRDAVAAARVLLSEARAFREQHEVTERLTAVETALYARGGDR